MAEPVVNERSHAIGMLCPGCGTVRPSFVVDSRLGVRGDYIRRRRECGACQWRWTTYERAPVGNAAVPLDVDKVCRAVEKAMGAHPAGKAAAALLRVFLAQLARAERAAS